MRHEQYWKIQEGESVPMGQMNREEADMSYRAAVRDRFVMQGSLHLPPIMEQDVWYSVNPETTKIKPKPQEVVEPTYTIIKSNGIQAVLHPFSSRRIKPY